MIATKNASVDSVIFVTLYSRDVIYERALVMPKKETYSRVVVAGDGNPLELRYKFDVLAAEIEINFENDNSKKLVHFMNMKYVAHFKNGLNFYNSRFKSSNSKPGVCLVVDHGHLLAAKSRSGCHVSTHG